MKKSLSDVTLVAVSSIKIPETVEALLRCCKNINFGAVKLISNSKAMADYPHLSHPTYKNIEIWWGVDLDDIIKYNDFIFHNLTKWIHTPYCLLIQYDSWILNADLWDDAWLEYDYIGAPWAIKDDAYICHDTGEHVRVGNGGFSLRSKKLLDIPNKYKLPLLQEQGWYNEDGNLCVYWRKKMLELGIKYAPIEVASVFSHETSIPENKGVRTFGFHKYIPAIYLKV